jgi:DNA polymerase III epsilon subunit-like protein
MYLLFFDLETTGLPIRESFNVFPDYKIISKYENCRVISFAFYLYDDKQHLLAKSYNIIYPDFKVENSHIHNITDEIAKKEGIYWNDIITIIESYIDKADFLIGHNIDFDINVLASELYRRGYKSLAEKIKNKKKFCTMVSGKNITRIQNGYKDFKYPKLSELYTHLFDEEMKDAHNAEADVENTIKCYFRMNKTK